MDKERMKKLGKDPRFISGIYNYCDRWCERCPFTSRCMNFELSEEDFADPETRDIQNEAFWNKLSETFQVTLELLKEMAEERGIDLDAIDDEETQEERRLKDEVVESNACCRAAKAYGAMVDDWFDSARDLFGEAEDEAEPVGPLGIRKVDPDREETSLEEALEVIRWYQHQIWVKLMRAVSCKGGFNRYGPLHRSLGRGGCSSTHAQKRRHGHHFTSRGTAKECGKGISGRKSIYPARI